MPSGSNARSKFDRLNAHLGLGVILPGRLIIVGDDSTAMCTRGELADVLCPGRASGADRQRLREQPGLGGELRPAERIMSYGSIGIGSVTSAWSAQLNQVESTLKDAGGSDFNSPTAGQACCCH